MLETCKRWEGFKIVNIKLESDKSVLGGTNINPVLVQILEKTLIDGLDTCNYPVKVIPPFHVMHPGSTWTLLTPLETDLPVTSNPGQLHYPTVTASDNFKVKLKCNYVEMFEWT